MAFTLYKTSKHSRVWREVVNGLATAVSKTSITQMHYESVAGSEDYDTPVDLAQVATDDADVDGFVVEENPWHFGLQTAAVPELSQAAQGTIGFGGRGGANTLRFKCTSMGYLHHPTRAFTITGPAFDYTAESPAFTSGTRNLGTHAGVPDLTITSQNYSSWSGLWSLGVDQVTRIHAAIKPGKLQFETYISKETSNEIINNDPPITTLSETEFGFLYELDVSDIPRVYQNGVLLDWGDDFTDDAGDLYLRDSSDNLIAIIPQATGELTRWFGGFPRTYRLRFWEDGGTNYMFIGEAMADWDKGVDRTSWSVFPFWILHDIELSTRGHTAYQGYSNGYPGYPAPPYDDPYYGPQEFAANVGGTAVGFGDFFSYSGTTGFRFRPDVPLNASLTGPGEYATLQMYASTVFAATGPAEVVFNADIYSSNQPVFAADFVDSPEPGSNFHLSKAATVQSFVQPGMGDPLEPVDMSVQIEEVTGLAKWLPGNALRIRAATTQESWIGYPPGYAYSAITLPGYESTVDLLPVLDLVYTERTAVRKPGVDDTTSLRNRRNSRLAGQGSNDAAFRDGIADYPEVATFDNKNRNRFS